MQWYTKTKLENQLNLVLYPHQLHLQYILLFLVTTQKVLIFNCTTHPVLNPVSLSLSSSELSSIFWEVITDSDFSTQDYIAQENSKILFQILQLIC